MAQHTNKENDKKNAKFGWIGPTYRFENGKIGMLMAN